MTTRPTLLIVDDLPANLMAFEEILRRDDIQIMTATSGGEALQMLLKQDVALAVIDVRMPEMDGFAVAELMRGVEKTRYIPIIFVTAIDSDQSSVFKGYDAGAVDFLFKPVDKRVLRSKVDTFIQLEKQRQQLLQAERIRETFMGILAHDLRNPLSAIAISAQAGLRFSSDRDSCEAFENILSIGVRMQRMVEQLLGVTQIRLGGGVQISPAPADLREIVTHALDEWVENRALLKVDAQGDTRGVWDADRLTRVISNLVGNAVKHGKLGAAIDIRLDGIHSQHVVIDVHNEGLPIPEHLGAVIFEPFRGTPSKGGLGLGLFISKEFVAAHGGTLDFVSDAANGTRFTVTLPRHAGASSMT